MTEKKRFERSTRLDPVKVITKKWFVPKISLVEDERVTREMDNKTTRLQYDKLRAIIEKTIDSVNDATGIMELLPDLNLVREILVASILSPKDLTEIKLNITTDNNVIPPEVTEIVRNHFTTVYDLESKLSTILADSLFNNGSQVMLPIPASGLNQIMLANSKALESIHNSDMKHLELPNIGLVGRNGLSNTNTIYGMESFTKNYFENIEVKQRGNIIISDNPLYLLAPTLMKVKQRVSVANSVRNSLGLEAIEYGNHKDKNVYVRKMYDYVESIMLKNQNLEDVGVNLDPIIINLPNESVIPVFVPGEPENHVGYYVILDEFCNPIQASKNSNFFKELNDKLEHTIGSSSNMLIKSSLNLQESDKERAAANIKQPIMDAYIKQMEEDLRNGVKDGAHGENVEISRPAELFRLMFARQLQKMQTRALYIPAEMLTYVAFDYDELGIGVSLIEKTKLYSSLRAILMFAQVMAGIKNSVPGRRLNITLEEDDPDPQGTIESVINEFAAIQSVGLPLGKLNPADIIDGIQRAAIQVRVEGNEQYPGTSIDIEERPRDMTKPDTELSEMLKRQQYAGMGVSPELADRSLEGDFATGITSANLLQTKRVMVWQAIFELHMTDFIHKYIFAGGPLFKELKDIWQKIEGEDKPSFAEMVSSLKMVFPRPDTAIIKAQKESFDEYVAFIEMGVALHVNEDMLRAVLKGEYSTDALTVLQNSILNHLKRQYLRKQNMLPELDELLTNDETGIVDAIGQHNEAIFKVIGELLPKLYKDEYHLVDKKTAEAIRKVEELKQADNPDGMPEGSSNETTDDTGSGEDTFGDTGDELDMTDLGLGDEESELSTEETPEVTEEDETTDETKEDNAVKNQVPNPETDEETPTE